MHEYCRPRIQTHEKVREPGSERLGGDRSAPDLIRRSRDSRRPRGSRRRPDGFTLIELLVVILVVGLIAAITIPRLNETRERAHLATIQQDFRNLGAAQERYHQTNMSYAVDLALIDFVPSPGVDVDVIEATATGWSASGTHRSVTSGRGCAIYLGNAAPPPLPGGGSHQAGVGVLECSNN